VTGKSAPRRVFGWEAGSDGAILRQVSDMKSEHRHELAENDLSKAITRVLKKAEPHSNTILLAALALTVIVVAVVYGMKSASGTRTVGFAEFTDCQTADEFENVADEYPHALVGAWARLRAGELYLDDGIRTSLTNRNLSNDNLHKAKDAFDQVLKFEGVEVPPEARERALYGLGTCLEVLSDGDTQPAIDAYKALLHEFEKTQYKHLVEERITALESAQAKEFYAWFHKLNPRPEDRPSPRDGLDFLEHTTPRDSVNEDDGTGLPPPPPSAQPQIEAPAPPAGLESGNQPTATPEKPATEPPATESTGTPEATPETPPDGSRPEGDAKSEIPQDSGGAADKSEAP